MNTTSPQITGSRTVGSFSYFYALEDQDDTTNSAPLGPNSGGQNYDAEFLGVGLDGDRLVIAIVTGQRPDNTLANFSPGDIRITTNVGVFGVEVGGSKVPLAGFLSGGDAGSTYKLGSDGHTKAVLNSDGSSAVVGSNTTSGLVTHVSQKAGTVWFDPTWILDPVSGGSGEFGGNQPVQLQFTGGLLKGQADYFYSLNSVTSQHAIIEVSIPTSYLLNSTLLSVQWAPSCGNDVLRVTQTIHMPEPASWSLMLIGGLGIAGYRRRRKCLAA